MTLPREAFSRNDSGQYNFLPFRFDRRSNGDYIVTNEVGELLILPAQTFRLFTEKTLSPTNSSYLDLKAKHFLVDGNSSALMELLAAKYHTKKSFLEGFTKLHIFVTTLRCNQSCPYCQVSRRNEGDAADRFDMSPEVLRRSIELMLSSPGPQITMEFQGGEPLLNFDLIKEAVKLSKDLNQRAGKHIDYVICTNLVPLKDEHLDFIKEHGMLVSTSLDGPPFLHDQNRPSAQGKNSYQEVTSNIRRAQEALGKHSVSALMTTTRESLKYPREIIDEYLQMDMGSIFLRELNPYGFAVKTEAAIGYTSAEFVKFYKEALDYIIEINRLGRTFSEAFASMILTKAFTPWPIGFVDLQSPSGAGMGVCVYNYDGDVYASDEARMLAEVGDTTFRMGNVLEDSYDDIFFGEAMQDIAAASCNESLAGCSECVYQAYCGADPIRNHRTQGDLYGNRAELSSFCHRNKPVIQHVIDLMLDADKDLERIFWAWITREDVNSIQLGSNDA